MAYFKFETPSRCLVDPAVALPSLPQWGTPGPASASWGPVPNANITPFQLNAIDGVQPPLLPAPSWGGQSNKAVEGPASEGVSLHFPLYSIVFPTSMSGILCVQCHASVHVKKHADQQLDRAVSWDHLGQVVPLSPRFVCTVYLLWHFCLQRFQRLLCNHNSQLLSDCMTYLRRFPINSYLFPLPPGPTTALPSLPQWGVPLPAAAAWGAAPEATSPASLLGTARFVEPQLPAVPSWEGHSSESVKNFASAGMLFTYSNPAPRIICLL